MKKNDKNRKKVSTKGVAASVSQPWRGYTLSELRYQRALTLLKMDVVSDRLNDYAQQYNPFSPARGGDSTNAFLRLMSSTKIADYAALALRTGKTAYRIWCKLKKQD